MPYLIEIRHEVFECNKCNALFTCKLFWKKHFGLNCPRRYSCIVCNLDFISKHLLQVHISTSNHTALAFSRHMLPDEIYKVLEKEGKIDTGISISSGKIGDPKSLADLIENIGQGTQCLSDGSQIFAKMQGENQEDGCGVNQRQEGILQACDGIEEHQIGDRWDVQTCIGDQERSCYEGNVHIYSFGVQQISSVENALKCSSNPILSTGKDKLDCELRLLRDKDTDQETEHSNELRHSEIGSFIHNIAEKNDAEGKSISSYHSTALLPLKEPCEKSDTIDKNESVHQSNSTLPLSDISNNVDAQDNSEFCQCSNGIPLKDSLGKNDPKDGSESHHTNLKLPGKDYSSPNTYDENDSNIKSEHSREIQKHSRAVDSNVSNSSVSLTKSVDSKEMDLGSGDFSDKSQNSCPNDKNGGYREKLGLNQSSTEFSQKTKAHSLHKCVEKTTSVLNNKIKPFKINIKALTRQLKTATASALSTKSKELSNSKVISKNSKEITTSSKEVSSHKKDTESNKSHVSFSIRENTLLKPAPLLSREEEDGFLNSYLLYRKANNSQLHELRNEIEKEKELKAEITKAHKEFSKKHIFGKNKQFTLGKKYRRMRKMYLEDESQTESCRGGIKDRDNSVKHDNAVTDSEEKKNKRRKVDHIDTDYYEKCLESWADGLDNQANDSEDTESQQQNSSFSLLDEINDSRENQNYEINRDGHQESTCSTVFERIKANEKDNQYHETKFTDSHKQSKCSSLLERIQANDKLRKAYETALTEQEGENLIELHEISSTQQPSTSKSNPKMSDTTRYESDSQHPHRLVIYSSSSESVNKAKHIYGNILSQDIIQKRQSRSRVRKKHNRSRSRHTSSSSSSGSCDTYRNRFKSRKRIRSSRFRTSDSNSSRSTSTDTSSESPSRSRHGNRKTWLGTRYRSRGTRSSLRHTSRETQSESSRETQSRSRQRSREIRSRSRQRRRDTRSRSRQRSREIRSRSRQRSRETQSTSSRETRSRSRQRSGETRSRQIRRETQSTSRQRSRETRSKSRQRSRETRSRSRQRSRETQSRSRQSSRVTRSRSRRRSRETRSRSRQRSRETRSRSRQRNRESRSRSRQRNRETRSRSRQSSREIRSRSRQRNRETRSRSRQSSRETRSRSGQRNRETRSRSRQSSRETRFRSRQRNRESRSRSRQRSRETRSRSRQRSRETQSRSRQRRRETRSRSRQRSREIRSRSRQRNRETRSRSRQRRETRSRSRQRSREIRFRSRQRNRETRSRSRQRRRETRSRSRQRNRETRSRSSRETRSRSRQRSRETQSRQTSRETRSRSRQRSREIRSRSRQTSPETRSRSRQRSQEIRSRSRHKSRGTRSKSRRKYRETHSRSKERSTDSDFRSCSSSSDRILDKLKPAFMDLVEPVHKSIHNRLGRREKSSTRSYSRSSQTSLNDLSSQPDETIQEEEMRRKKETRIKKRMIKKIKMNRKRDRKHTIRSMTHKKDENYSSKEMFLNKENNTKEKDYKKSEMIIISSDSSSPHGTIERTNKQRKRKRRKIGKLSVNGETLQNTSLSSPEVTFKRRNEISMTNTIHPVTNVLPDRHASEKDSETSDKVKKNTIDSYSNQHSHPKYMSAGSLQMESLSESDGITRHDSREGDVLKNLVLERIYRRYITESSAMPKKARKEPDKELCSVSEKESNDLSATKQTVSAGCNNCISEQSTGDCIMHEEDRTDSGQEDEALRFYETGSGLADSRKPSNSGDISDSGVTNLVYISEKEYDHGLVQSCRIDSSTNEVEKSDPKTSSLKGDPKDEGKESADSVGGHCIAEHIEESSKKITALQNSNQLAGSESATVTSSAKSREDNEILENDIICLENLDSGTSFPQERSDSDSIKSFLLFDADDELTNKQVVPECKRRTSVLLDAKNSQELVSNSENEMNEDGNVCHETIESCYRPDEMEETEKNQCNHVASEEIGFLEHSLLNNSYHRLEWMSESVKLRGRTSTSSDATEFQQAIAKQKEASSKPSESHTFIPSLEEETPDTSSPLTRRSQKPKGPMKCVENKVINYLTNTCPECESVLILDEFTSVNLRTGDITIKCQQCLMYTFMKGALALSARSFSTKCSEKNSDHIVELSADKKQGGKDKENISSTKGQGTKPNGKSKKPRKVTLEEKLKALNNRERRGRKTKGKYPILRPTKAKKTAAEGL